MNSAGMNSAGAAGTTGTAGGAGPAGGAGVSGASGSAGTSGVAGSAGSTGSATQSAGCDKIGWPTASPTMLDVTDKASNTVSRQYYFALPAGYDGTKPYPVVFAWHYLGGTASAIAGNGFTGHYYGIQPLFPNAIYVAPQGLTDASSGNTGFPNTNDQDIAFAKTMVSWFESNFCVDTSRLFSTGFSYGGMMSHTISCEMPDVFRAVGIMSGIDIFNPSTCVKHGIPAWITHGDMDTTLPFSSGETARDRIVAANQCGSTTHPVDPSVDSGACVQYDGCDSDPVVWCPVAGEGHAIPNFGASSIAAFFKQF
jgi:poly(3-hydroxybutyrate) depolymerase